MGRKNKNVAHYLHKEDRGDHRGRRRFRALRSDLHCLRVHQKEIYFRMLARPAQNLQEPLQQYKVYTDATCNASGQSVSFCLIHDCSHDNWRYMYRYNVNLDSSEAEYEAIRMCLSSLANNSRISVITDHMGNISRFYQEVNNKLGFPYDDECWFWYDRKLVTLQWKKRNSIVEQHVCHILARGLNKLYYISYDIVQSPKYLNWKC